VSLVVCGWVSPNTDTTYTCTWVHANYCYYYYYTARYGSPWWSCLYCWCKKYVTVRFISFLLGCIILIEQQGLTNSWQTDGHWSFYQISSRAHQIAQPYTNARHHQFFLQVTHESFETHLHSALCCQQMKGT